MKSKTFGQALRLLELIEDKKIPFERLQALYSSGILSDVLDSNPANVNRAALRRLLQVELLFGVDYSLTKSEMLDHSNSAFFGDDIKNDKFPVSKLNGIISFEGIIAGVLDTNDLDMFNGRNNPNPWGFACIEHLCAVSREYPHLQREFSIMARGNQAIVYEYGLNRRPKVDSPNNGAWSSPCLDYLHGENGIRPYRHFQGSNLEGREIKCLLVRQVSEK